MREMNLKLTLLEDVVINERPATEGGHKGLDYLPGVVLLGAVAARLYSKLSPQDAWQVFHSGQVQFGDALPLVDDHPCWPLPLCWHDKKLESALKDGRIDGALVQNFQHGPFPGDAQPKQLRSGYVRADGRHISIHKSFRMKTALDPATGRISESQLFGYDSIDAGQTFVARIRASTEVRAELWDKLTSALTESKAVLLGRSRSAEYGRAEIWPLELALEPETAPATAQIPPTPLFHRGASNSNEVTLWCLSDVALLDAVGQPTLEPTAAALGLKRGEIDWERSFLRFRRYAIWNAHRNGYDLERQVIQHGSVIALKLDSPLTDAERQHLAAGIGLYREAGLGWVSVNPQLLATAQPKFASAISAAPASLAPKRPKNESLIVWLEQQQTDDQARSADEHSVREYRNELKRRYGLARAYAGVPDHLPIGPSKAQWGSVYEQARMEDSANFAKLKRELFDGTNAICKPEGEGWQDVFRDAAGVRKFRDWLIVTVDALATVHKVRLFAREAIRVADRERDHKTANQI
jgi:CRISPR-associated protein Csx10